MMPSEPGADDTRGTPVPLLVLDPLDIDDDATMMLEIPPLPSVSPEFFTPGSLMLLTHPHLAIWTVFLLMYPYSTIGPLGSGGTLTPGRPPCVTTLLTLPLMMTQVLAHPRQLMTSLPS